MCVYFHFKKHSIDIFLSLCWFLVIVLMCFCFMFHPIVGVFNLHTRFTQGDFKSTSAQIPSLKILIPLLGLGKDMENENILKSITVPNMNQVC